MVVDVHPAALSDPFGNLISAVVMQDQACGAAILAGFEGELQRGALVEKMPFRGWKYPRLVGKPTNMKPVASRRHIEHPIPQLIASNQAAKTGGIDRDLLAVRHQVAAWVQHMDPEINNGIDARVAEHGHSTSPFRNAFDEAAETTCTAGFR